MAGATNQQPWNTTSHEIAAIDHRRAPSTSTELEGISPASFIGSGDIFAHSGAGGTEQAGGTAANAVRHDDVSLRGGAISNGRTATSVALQPKVTKLQKRSAATGSGNGDGVPSAAFFSPSALPAAQHLTNASSFGYTPAASKIYGSHDTPASNTSNISTVRISLAAATTGTTRALPAATNGYPGYSASSNPPSAATSADTTALSADADSAAVLDQMPRLSDISARIDRILAVDPAKVAKVTAQQRFAPT
jgi:hypothetical protein